MSPNRKGMPKAPWIYVCEPPVNGVPIPDDGHAKQLAALIPDAQYWYLEPTALGCNMRAPKKFESTVLIIHDQRSFEYCRVQENVKQLKAHAIKLGANFASVSVLKDVSKASNSKAFGTNHLVIAQSANATKEIYDWLCEHTHDRITSLIC